MNDTPWVHFTVEETDRGWIVWVKVTTSARRYQGPATMYPFPSAEAAWRWVAEQLGLEAAAGGGVEDEPSASEPQ